MEIKVVLAPRPDLEGVNQQSLSGGGDEESTWQQKSGLSLRNVEPRYAQSIGAATEGALVTDVAPGSPAERAGLAPGMIITEISRKPVRNSSEAVRALKSAKSGSTVLIRALQRGVDSDGSPSPSPSLHALAIP